jgi:hypothetical protein
LGWSGGGCSLLSLVATASVLRPIMLLIPLAEGLILKFADDERFLVHEF